MGVDHILLEQQEASDWKKYPVAKQGDACWQNLPNIFVSIKDIAGLLPLEAMINSSCMWKDDSLQWLVIMQQNTWIVPHFNAMLNLSIVYIYYTT